MVRNHDEMYIFENFSGENNAKDFKKENKQAQH